MHTCIYCSPVVLVHVGCVLSHSLLLTRTAVPDSGRSKKVDVPEFGKDVGFSYAVRATDHFELNTYRLRLNHVFYIL